MLRLVKQMMPATNTNSINATISARCFSAKATTVFIPSSVGPGSAIDKDRTAGHNLLAGCQAGKNFDHAIAGSSGADLAQCQVIAVAGHPDASLLAFVDNRALWNRRRAQCLPGNDAEIPKHSGF